MGTRSLKVRGWGGMNGGPLPGRVTLHIVYYPDPVLKRPAAPVGEIPDNIEDIVEGMREVMELEKGIGLAAPQVGLSIRLILVRPGDDPEDELVLINPEITRYKGKKEWGEEGCLSFPGIWGQVLRHPRVEVRYTDLEGAEQTLDAEDLLARILQHEIDHLDGKLFVFKMRPSDRIAAKAQLRDLEERYEILGT